MIKGSCRIHGNLNDETGFKYRDKKIECGYRLKCKKCYDTRVQKYIDNNLGKEFVLPENPIGNCRVHGPLNKDTGFITFDRASDRGYRLRCRECSYVNRVNTYLNNANKIKEKAVKWKKENRNLINEKTKEDRKNNPEKYKKWASDYYDRNRDKLSLNQSLKAKKVSLESYEIMLSNQKNKCAICGQEEIRVARCGGANKTRLCIDHNHKTGEVRALLCHDCNTGIGKFKDFPELLLKAADYLIFHNGWTE